MSIATLMREDVLKLCAMTSLTWPALQPQFSSSLHTSARISWSSLLCSHSRGRRMGLASMACILHQSPGFASLPTERSRAEALERHKRGERAGDMKFRTFRVEKAIFGEYLPHTHLHLLVLSLLHSRYSFFCVLLLEDLSSHNPLPASRHHRQ